MSIWYMGFIAAVIVLFVAPLAFVFNDDYEDGVVGRIGLLAMSFCAAIFLIEIFFGSGYHIEREESGIVVGMAIFLVWHLRKFCLRIQREKARARMAERSLAV